MPALLDDFLCGAMTYLTIYLQMRFFVSFQINAFPIMATKSSAPPIRVYAEASSPKNSQTQNGPSKTSARDSNVNSAAGSVREPNV